MIREPLYALVYVIVMNVQVIEYLLGIYSSNRIPCFHSAQGGNRTGNKDGNIEEQEHIAETLTENTEKDKKDRHESRHAKDKSFIHCVKSFMCH